MSQTMGTMAGVSSCVTLAGHIIDLLMTAKGNKEEFTSLLVAVQSICSFLKHLPEDGITPQGNTVLREWLRQACRLCQGMQYRQLCVMTPKSTASPGLVPARLH
jgi:hypothetical protein